MKCDASLKKYAVIYNAHARNADKLPIDEIVKIFDERGIHPLIYRTRGRGDGINLVKKAVDDGAARIYAAGGDGTLNEVVSGLMRLSEDDGEQNLPDDKKSNAFQKNTASFPQVCPLPLGTVNVFAKERGFSSNPRAALISSFTAKTSPMDIGACNQRYFIMMSSIGLDAFIIDDIERMIARDSKIKKIFGPFAYLIVGVKSLFNYNFDRLKITAYSVFGVKEFYADFAVVSNTKFYGGSYILSEKADPCDGYLDLFMLESKNIYDYFKFFFQVLTKRYDFRGLKISRYQVKRCVIERANEKESSGVYSQLDGELFSPPPLNIKVIEKALEMVSII